MKKFIVVCLICFVEIVVLVGFSVMFWDVMLVFVVLFGDCWVVILLVGWMFVIIVVWEVFFLLESESSVRV